MITKTDNSKLLTTSDITFDPASSIDEFGRVFWYQGRVYRGVSRKSEELAHRILRMASDWAKYGLIDTSESGLRLESFGMVFQHRTIEFRSYCTEWIPEMLRDAALTYLRLQLKLVEDGYVLKDGHPWNVLFDQGHPVYVDVGSVIPFDKVQLTRSLWEFQLYFLLPLRLLSIWGAEKTYAFLNRPIPNHDERVAIARQVGMKPIQIFRLFGIRFGLKRLIRKLEGLTVSGVGKTEWTGYEQKSPDITDPDSFAAKQRPAYEVLKRLGSGTVLDIGCNKGWYSLLAETMGFKVVSVDIDLDSLSTLYDHVKGVQRHILPLYVDICEPTSANGLNGAYPAFMERMVTDVVFAMAVVHHLAYKRRLTFETFAERIARLTRKVAVVEFIPREDVYVCQWSQEGMEWYNRQRFVEAFMKHFERMESFPSTPPPREVFVFEKSAA